MLELILAVVMVVTMGKIADVDGQSPVLWGGAAIGALFVCFFIPLPYARVLIAAALTGAAMVVYKVARNK